MRAVVSLLFILIFHSGVNAFTLDNKLRDKSMEKRATSLFEIIRCPICSGESLSESGSQIAYDMREAIRKKINDGYTDEEIISELKNSYGNSIIIVPPIKSSTYILWFIPLTTLLIGCFLIQRYINTTT
ncbi:cytochrome c-type biogenesis protein CcmH [Wolbachia endosymbiont of Carposina sasakii]|jgi:cytochrome c-type biogenesis protein CcmH|uniref:Cytochrome c-type biogenesis protein n=2 Tax=Wolbachia TaxID=953 RepID=A0A6I6CFS0_WOLPI|nr:MULTISPECIES: cytochrome c-type biogenesis protein CcmH [Wolbachia]MDX5487612.1 cytochrome c-type biogenesis protein CcmH [Wolbachia endosymbiont of Andrena praecox]MDX5498027.1 cytochrome c-type biogenesis protein CcmH [Wolbachia endosymbiont of Lasioglossum nitidulum]MDX5509881.1 cytochrome c-type biogenesis protein CcmH [Wolbachia endosymbiont of Lasioglossum morio]MDX5542890.1 cytochrome c-type biogenesis protein CcmH [Wolbachia endosymbiont of Andrena apicata]MDX5561385.1 cytochrome c-